MSRNVPNQKVMQESLDISVQMPGLSIQDTLKPAAKTKSGRRRCNSNQTSGEPIVKENSVSASRSKSQEKHHQTSVTSNAGAGVAEQNLSSFQECHNIVTGAKPKIKNDRSSSTADSPRSKVVEELRNIKRKNRYGSRAQDESSSNIDQRELPSSSNPATPPQYNASTSTPKESHSGKKSSSIAVKLPRHPVTQNNPQEFEPYLSLEEVQSGLEKGELIEGVLRINSRSSDDAYITAPDGAMDIYIGGNYDRNRTLHGDAVVLKLKDVREWKIHTELLKKCMVALCAKVSQHPLKEASPKSASVSQNPQDVSTIKLSESEVHSGAPAAEANQKKRRRRGKKSKGPKKDAGTVPHITDTGSEAKQEKCNFGEVSEQHEMLNQKKHSTLSDTELESIANASSVGALLNNFDSKDNSLSKVDNLLNAAVENENCDVTPCSNELNQVLEDVALCCAKSISKVDANVNSSLLCTDMGNTLMDDSSSCSLGPNTLAESEVPDLLCDFNQVPEDASDIETMQKLLKKVQKLEDNNSTKNHRFGIIAVHQLCTPAEIEIVKNSSLTHKFLQKTAKVVFIQEMKHSRIGLGYLKPMDYGNSFVLFVPIDNQLPRMKIQMRECPHDFVIRPQDYASTLFAVKVLHWNHNMLSIGSVVKCLGNAEDVAVQAEAILFVHNLKYEDFPSSALDCLPKTLLITEEDIGRRVDLREECIFTIDPKTARDMDDAVSCKQISDDVFEIGVHIADVSHFVKEGSELDKIAAHRATSVYLTQQVIPMLPRVLCDDLCSLKPGEDRLTFSVLFQINRNGEIISTWFGRTVIHSCVKLSYEHAQMMLDDKDHVWQPEELPAIFGGFTINEVTSKVLQLNELAVCLRSKRFEGGSLQLTQTKLEMLLDWESGTPIGYSLKKGKPSHKLIEEFMLLSNMAVAKKIHEKFPLRALLRRHLPPKVPLIDETAEVFNAAGYHLDQSSAGTIQKSIEKFPDNPNFTEAVNNALINLLAKPMQRAEYICSGNGVDNFFCHYALNVDLYTHFTSPIRRYPDVVVHRLLAAALDDQLNPTMTVKDMSKITDHCNNKKWDAKHAEDMNAEMLLAIFVKAATSDIVMTAVVVHVMDHSFDVIITNLGIIKRVYCDASKVDVVKYESSENGPVLEVEWQQANQNGYRLRLTITLLAEVNIKLVCSDLSKLNAILVFPDC